MRALAGGDRAALIVTCERCASQFQLDETKISPQGVRARCARCEHVFFVESPARPDADHARELVRDTLGTVRAEAGSESIADIPDRSSHAEPAAETNESVKLGAVEDDWEFNDDSGAMASPVGEADALDDELSAAREAVDDLLGSVLDLSTSPPTRGDADSESFLGLDLDIASDMRNGMEVDEIDESGPASIDDPEPASIVDCGDDDGSNSESLADREGEPEADANPQKTGVEDFDDPANWDLFDSETSGAALSGALEPQRSEQSFDSVPAEPIVAPRGALPGAMEPDQSKWRVVEAAGWTLVAALLAVGVLGGLSTPNLQPKPWLVESVAAPGFEVQGVSTRWIQNAIAGRLFVISGKIRRSPGTTPWNVTPLAVQLLDANGRSLDLPLTAIGPEIPEQSLRDTSPADLVELQNGRAVHFAATAASWLSFAAVVPALPVHAERFEFSPLKPDAGFRTPRRAGAATRPR
ncbi:MAG: zinc-ribbon domain-containing protein [Myxococcota bacterium]